MVSALEQPNVGEHIACNAPGSGLMLLLAGSKENRNNRVLQHRHFGEWFDDLERPSNSRPTDLIRPQALNWTPVKENLSDSWPQVTCDQAEESRFPSAVCTDYAEHLAMLHRKADITERPQPSELLRDVSKLQQHCRSCSAG